MALGVRVGYRAYLRIAWHLERGHTGCERVVSDVVVGVNDNVLS
jgi:hypothetical protein